MTRFGASGAVSNGLGDPNVSNGYSRADSSGTHYVVKSNPGNSFSVVITPSGSTPSGSLTGNFSVEVSDVTVSVAGTMLVSGTPQALVGQRQSATISAGYPLTNIHWGGPTNAYSGVTWTSNYTTPSGTYDAHHYIPVTSADLATNPYGYFIAEPASYMVPATATIHLPDGTTPTVAGEGGVDVMAPDYTYDLISTGTSRLEYVSPGVWIQSGDNTNVTTVGARFGYTVQQRMPFNATYNSICYLSQLVQTTRTGTRAITGVETMLSRPNYSQDTLLVYDDPVAPYSASPAYHNTGAQADTPGQGYQNSGTNRYVEGHVNDNFKMFLIYVPPSSSAGASYAVPLSVRDWQWHSYAGESSPPGIWIGPSGNPSGGAKREFPTRGWEWDDYVGRGHW